MLSGVKNLKKCNLTHEDLFSRVLRFINIFFTDFYFFHSISLFLTFLTGVQLMVRKSFGRLTNKG